MVTDTDRKPKQKRAKPIRGLGRDARVLGVHRSYLSMVAHGHRSSNRLTARWTALRSQQRGGGAVCAPEANKLLGKVNPVSVNL